MTSRKSREPNLAESCRRHVSAQVIAGVAATVLLGIALPTDGALARQPSLLTTFSVFGQIDLPASASPASLRGARDVFASFGMAPSEWRFFEDGSTIRDRELEILHRVLFLLPKIDAVQRHRWTKPVVPWQQLATDPTEERGDLFALSGRVTSIREERLPPELARRYSFTRFYLVELAPTADAPRRQIYVREIPGAWKRAEDAGQATFLPVPRAGWPIRCDAVFLKMGDAGNPLVENTPAIAASPADIPNGPPAIFAALRLGWYPTEPALGPPAIGRSLARLGASGMDISLLQGLAQRRPLERVDREPFYQMLWTMRRLRLQETEQPSVMTVPPLPLADVLLRPAEFTGERFRIEGLARRVIRIQVPDADIQERFGIDHYYEIELFLELPRPVVIHDPQTGVELPYDRFPVTICTPQIPADMPQGDDIRYPITADAHFFKIWSYRSQFVQRIASGPAATEMQPDIWQGRAEQRGVRQQSPLLVATGVLPLVHDPPDTHWPLTALSVVLFGGFFGILCIRWWYRRQDQRFDQWRRTRRLRERDGPIA